jgi:hypothetical protein
LSELGRAYKHQGRSIETEKTFIEAVKIIEETKILGLQHPRTRILVYQLTEIYKEQNRADEVEKPESEMKIELG